MINQDLVKIINDWRTAAIKESLCMRDILPSIDTKTREIVDIIGPRRSGKSFILMLLIKQLHNKNNWLYINFEDPFFVNHNTPLVIEELIETYKEYFSSDLECLFFDEIQNIEKWETAIRKLRDSTTYKIYITGSSSKLLSGELATLVTGRHLSYQTLPLSFSEYLRFTNTPIKTKKDLFTHKTLLKRKFLEYVTGGGFPQVVLEGKQELLKQYYSDSVQKDIVKRHNVREKTILEQMGLYLMSNSAKTISIAALEKTYDISYELASTYLEYFKDAFLMYDMPKFSYSLKTQQKALKKIYSVDTGLARAVSFRFSEDNGRMLENAAFLRLKQLKSEIFYYKTATNRECDFLVRKPDGSFFPIQVCWSLEDEATKKRELAALEETMDEMKCANGLILTFDSSESISVGAKTIRVTPVYQWMLESPLS